jgi:hypothetical protein
LRRTNCSSRASKSASHDDLAAELHHKEQGLAAAQADLSEYKRKLDEILIASVPSVPANVEHHLRQPERGIYWGTPDRVKDGVAVFQKFSSIHMLLSIV